MFLHVDPRKEYVVIIWQIITFPPCQDNRQGGAGPSFPARCQVLLLGRYLLYSPWRRWTTPFCEMSSNVIMLRYGTNLLPAAFFNLWLLEEGCIPYCLPQRTDLHTVCVVDPRPFCYARGSASSLLLRADPGSSLTKKSPKKVKL